MRREIPLAITFITALIMIVSFFIPHAPFGSMQDVSLKWYSIIAGFTMLLGVDSLIHMHSVKIKRKKEGWVYSLVLILGFALFVISGIIGGIRFGSAMDIRSSFMYLYTYMIVPLQSTMFALLSFFIASAAYRAFRARNMDATLLLITAVLVMLGRVPVGYQMWHSFPAVAEWIMAVPQMAAKRGILIGVSLGSLAVSLRIMLGIERSYLS